MAVSCMRSASGRNYWNSSFIVELAMGQIPRSTERISSFGDESFQAISCIGNLVLTTKAQCPMQRQTIAET